MICCPTVKKRSIRSHYDLATPFYRLLWGPHIHHGLWTGRETPAEAQRNLTDTLCREANLVAKDRVLDVGCGMGGSSIRVAKTVGCSVTGITLSPVQRSWAALAAGVQGVGKRVRFLTADAETISFEQQSFDAVWSVECTEHLFDKGAFFRKAATWLRPGGCVAICAWQAKNEPLDAEEQKQVYDVCEGFLCPSLGSADDYRRWLTDAGLTIECSFDWTTRVLHTWEICSRRVRQSRVAWLARVVDREQALFLDRFETILRAYRTGAMTYGCWVARKPFD